MRAALAQYQIVGVRTNVEFLGRLMSAPSFVEAKLDTALIERERAHLFAPRGEAAPLHVGAGGAGVWLRRSAGRRTAPRRRPSPWDDRGGWRARRRAASSACDSANVRSERGNRGCDPAKANRRARRRAATRFTCSSTASTGSSDWRRSLSTAPSELPMRTAGCWRPMPGRVLAVLVKAGDEVAQGRAARWSSKP